MKSPFPGMDPYLEPHWPGLHTHLVSLGTAQLNRSLPEDLVAQADERLNIEGADEETLRSVAADVVVYQPGELDLSEGGIAISAPYKLVVNMEPLTQRFIRIIRAEDARLITVIEFISPANKTGGLEQYLQKRDEFLSAGVHMVEIDLTRRGNWRTLLRPHVCPREAVAPYRVTVRVGGKQTAYLYPVSLRQPLPGISIPLRAGDKAVTLHLQPLLDEAYANGRYGRTINYSVPPEPPLDGDDAAWAAGVAKSATA